MSSFFDEVQKSFFFPGSSPASGATAQDMRRKIALAMLMKKTPFPKTFGEGLAAIGDAWGDRSLAARTELEASQQAAKTDAEIAKIPGVSATTGPRAEVVVPLADQVAEAADSPAPNALAAAPPPPAATASAAVAGFRPPPGYLAPYLAASGLPPERQAFLGHMAGKEAKSANEVSPTGAAGPLQFIRSTGRQYGLVGPGFDRRTDPAASIAAGNRLTDDNAAVLARGLGRPPSPGELALAHQQGAGTAVKMLTGTGNAPDYNLRVNNAGGLGGQAAANKIMAYYNMPGSGGGVAPPPGSRDSIAATVLNADTPPTPGDMAQETHLGDVTGMRRAPPSFGATASNRTGDVMSDAPPITGALQGPLGQAVGDTVQARQDTLAPPQAAPLQQPPGPQIAQAGVFPPVQSAGGQVAPILPGGGFPPTPQIQQAPPDPRAAIRTAPPEEYKPRNRPQPEPPVAPGMGPIEAQLTRDILNKDVDGRLKAAASARIAQEQAQRIIPYNNAMKKYEADIADWKEEQKQERGYRMTLPKQAADVDQSRASAGKATLESDKLALELGGYPAQLVQERLKREAEVGKAQSEAETTKLRAEFEKRTGREREPFIKDFTAEKEQVSKIAPMLRDVQLAKEALNSGAVASGFGAEAKLDAARVAAKIGSTDARKIAEATENYQKAMGRTISYAIMLVNGKDPRVTEGDVAMAKGNQGSASDQEASKRKIIEVMQADLHGKVANYEDMREQYLRGDPQHRLFKVDTPPTAPPAVTGALLKHRDDESIRRRYDADYGPGAAELEIKRAKRRERRAREDD